MGVESFEKSKDGTSGTWTGDYEAFGAVGDAIGGRFGSSNGEATVSGGGGRRKAGMMKSSQYGNDIIGEKVSFVRTLHSQSTVHDSNGIISQGKDTDMQDEGGNEALGSWGGGVMFDKAKEEDGKDESSLDSRGGSSIFSMLGRKMFGYEEDEDTKAKISSWWPVKEASEVDLGEGGRRNGIGLDGRVRGDVFEEPSDLEGEISMEEFVPNENRKLFGGKVFFGEEEEGGEEKAKASSWRTSNKVLENADEELGRWGGTDEDDGLDFEEPNEKNGMFGIDYEREKFSSSAMAFAGENFDHEEDVDFGLDTLATPSDQSSRHLAACNDYTFKRYCTHKQSFGDACGQPQGVRVECRTQYGGTAADIILDSTKKDTRWYCSNSEEWFRPDHDWNRLRWNRSGRDITWNFYYCEALQRLNGAEYNQEVNLRSGNSCLSLPERSYSYGVEESITGVTCNSANTKQDFYLEPLDSDRKYRLRPKDSFNADLAICVSLPGPKTHYCNRDSNDDSLTIKFASALGTFNTNFNIVPTGTESRPSVPIKHDVRLINAASGGMMYLRLEPHIIYGYNAAEPPEDGMPAKYGEIHFEEKNYGGQTGPTKFYVSPSTNPSEFVLRPRGSYDSSVNACIMSKDPLSINNCGSGRDIVWKVKDGRLVSTKDEALCLTHLLSDGKGVSRRCTNDASSYVAIVPAGDWRTSQFNQLSDIFPHSSIQLSGNDEYSRITFRPDHTNTGLEMTEDFVIEFSFVLDSAVGQSHKMCVIFDNGSDKCFNLAGNLPGKVRTVNEEFAKADTNNLYMIKPWESQHSERRVEYLRFQQSGDQTTRSRFFSIEAYDMVSHTVIERRDTSLTIQIDFPEGTTNTAALHYLPSVLLQDHEGNFAVSLPNAEKLLEMHQVTRQIIISGLEPGRRFLIKLNPVQSTEDPWQAGDSRRTLKALFKEYTSCSCNPDEITGKPQNLIVSQSGGQVALTFIDYSVCEEAYAFTRSSETGSDLVSYSPNYFFYSTKPCSQEIIEPRGEFMDAVSKLNVGDTYEYCTSAVGKTYMVDTETEDGSFIRSSNETCREHVVAWEASTVIRVTLKEEAGKLPVGDVGIAWELRIPGQDAISGTGNTTDDGEIVITIYSESLDSSATYPLHVTPTKTTGNVTHEFLCDSERQLCSEEEPVGYLTHLHFGQVISIADKTSVPFRGKVEIELPEYNMEGPNCPGSPEVPLGGANVCLVRKSLSVSSPDTVTTCIDTDPDGTYELPATFGTTVYPTVTYYEHEFLYVKRDSTIAPKDPTNTTGFLITESGYDNSEYEGHDFVDVTKEDLIVEVAGGLCNINLGSSILQVSFASFTNCHWKIQQDGYKKVYTGMPAHELIVSMDKLEVPDGSRVAHLEYLKNGVGDLSVDLVDVSANEPVNDNNSTESRFENDEVAENQAAAANRSDTSGSAMEEEKEAAAKLRTARFQYNGRALIFPEIASGKDQLGGSCRNLTREKITESEFRSTHVVRTGALFELIITVRQEILRDEQVFCDVLGTDEPVELENRVGLRALDPDDNIILQLLTKGGADVSNYIRCTEDCALPIIPPPPESSDKSHAVVMLQAGTPNPTGDFKKYINIKFGGTQHEMNVIVTGDKSTGGVPFSMPTHFPLLVIRDPPGGSSFATYTNMQHTASITMESYEKYMGIDGGVSVQVDVSDSQKFTCAGVGAMVCEETVQTEFWGQASVEASGMFLENYMDDSYTHGFTVEWSYTTSDEIFNPGKDSDLILVPVILVKHTLTNTVIWNETECEANVTQSTKIDLSSPENQRAFSVITTHHAREVEIPRLEKVLETLEVTAAADPENITTTDEYRVTQASYLSWQQFLLEYEQTNDGGLLNVGQWFNWYSDNRIKTPNCTVLTQTWECQTSSGNFTEITTKQHRCDQDDPDVLVSQFDTDEYENYFDSEGQPKCPNPSSVRTILFNHTSLVSELPEDHEYWKQWSFRHPLPKDKPHTGLAPNVLVDGAKTNTETEALAQMLVESSLESTGRIVFSGGGGEFSMTLGSDHLKSLVEKYNGDADIGDFDNAQQTFDMGLELNAGGEIFGMGVTGNARAAFHYSIDHKVLSSNEISDETSVSFSLSDPDIDDEFQVDIFFDPKYGTFVFRTVGGQSKCPHEEGTSKLENPKITQIWQPGPNILPDDEMVFEVQIQNDGLGGSYFDFFIDPLDVEGALSFDMLSPFYLESTVKDSSAVTKTAVTVSRGPKLYEYNPVRIVLKSACEQRARAKTRQGNIPVAEDVLSNVGIGDDKKIEFLRPCPTINIVGDLQRRGHFIINEGSEETMPIQIFNPLFSKNGKLTSMRRKGDDLVDAIELRYRRVGNLQWQKGRHEQNGEHIDIRFETQEDSYGYSEVDWYVEDLPEVDTEIQVFVKCGYESSLPDAMNFYLTEIIQGTVDRTKPSVMGYPQPQVNLIPGDDLVVQFTEDIWCGAPFGNVRIEVEGIALAFELGEGLDIICSGNTLVIQFVKDVSDAEGFYDNLLSRDYVLTIFGIKDMNGNLMDEYVYSSQFICLPPVPTLEVNHPAGDRPYLPDEPILFEVTLANEARALSYLELGVDPRSNVDNLEVLVNGESIAIPHNYILQASEEVETVVSVSKGAGPKLRFDPIRLFLRSKCAEDSNNPTEVEVFLYNHQDGDGEALIFQHPCPSIRWAGTMNQFSEVRLNGDTLDVSIFNEDYTNRKLFDRSNLNTALEANRRGRLRDVVLFYRRIDELGVLESPVWTMGTLMHDGSTTDAGGRFYDFSTESIENSFGYAQLQWDVSGLDDDITYQVKVTSRCTPLQHSHDELAYFNTDIVQVVIDRTPPEIYGVPSFMLPSTYVQGGHHPSHEFVIPFTEEIYCYRPYTFTLEITLTHLSTGAVTELHEGTDIHVKCEGKYIKYRFSAAEMTDYSTRTNSNVRLRLSGVEDLARNVMASEYDRTFTQCDQTLSGTNRIYVGMGCDRFDNDCDLEVDECDEDLVPPSMVLPDALKVDTDLSGSDPIHTLMYPTCFNTTDNAQRFLEANIAVSDDCSRDVRLEVELQTMTNAGLALFNATATDERCEGGNGIHVHTEYFHVEIFNGYDTQGLLSDDTIVRGMGCDGRDQNCNFIIDDCDEDLVPPIISFKEGLTVSAFEEEDGLTIIDSPAFSLLQDAQKYLYSIIKAEDDCAKLLNIEVSLPSVANCGATEFTVTVTDPRCSPPNDFQTVTKRYALWVDLVPPTVSIVLERGTPMNIFYANLGPTVAHIDQGQHDYEDVGFSYFVDDDCAQEAQVKMTILSNEFEYSHEKTSQNMVLIEERHLRNSQSRSHGLKIFVEALACDRKESKGLVHLKPLCEWDEDTSPFRFYTIEVQAIDYAGNVNEATASVFILEKGYLDDLSLTFGTAFDDNTFFIDYAARTPPQFIIARKELTWDTTLPSGSTTTTPSSSATAEAQTQTAASVTTTIELEGLAFPQSDEDLAAMIRSIELSLMEVIAPGLESDQQISDITVTSIGDRPVGRRHLQGAGATTSVEFTVTVLDVCTEDCANVGNVILAEMRDQITTAVDSKSFTVTLQQVSTDNGVESLQNVSVVAVDGNFDLSTTLESHVNVALSSEIILGGLDMARFGDDVVSALHTALERALQNVGCIVIATESCSATIVSHSNQPPTVFVYDVNIQVDCASSDCADIDQVANSLNAAVMAAIETSSESGDLITALQQLLPSAQEVEAVEVTLTGNLKMINFDTADLNSLQAEDVSEYFEVAITSVLGGVLAPGSKVTVTSIANGIVEYNIVTYTAEEDVALTEAAVSQGLSDGKASITAAVVAAADASSDETIKITLNTMGIESSNPNAPTTDITSKVTSNGEFVVEGFDPSALEALGSSPAELEVAEAYFKNAIEMELTSQDLLPPGAGVEITLSTDGTVEYEIHLYGDYASDSATALGLIDSALSNDSTLASISNIITNDSMSSTGTLSLLLKSVNIAENTQLSTTGIPTISIADVSQILDNVIVTSDSSSSVWITSASASSGFFPDFGGKSLTCKNGIAPGYMQGDDSFLHESLAECCETHFTKFYHLCAGSTVGFYPNWSGSNGIKCSNNNETIPIYMKQASGTYQHDTIEECCENYFKWDMDDCIVKSGGKLANVAQNEWYVNYEKKTCQQNCLEDTGETQYGVSGLNCGGIAPMWERLYPTVQDCCRNNLEYLSLSVCVAESKPPPSFARGTTRWYVSYTGEKCVQDCSNEENTIAGIISCGGIVRDASVILFDSPAICCEETMPWIPTDACVSESIDDKSGWLQDFIADLTD